MSSAPRTPDLPDVAPSPKGVSPKVFAAVGLVSAAALVALIVWLSRAGASAPTIDVRIHAWVLDHRSPISLTVAQAITWAGAVAVVLPLLVVVATAASPSDNGFPRRLRAGLLVAASAGIGIWLGLQINAWSARLRPPAVDWASAAGGPAFPSGHTTAATIVAASCAWVIAARTPAGWPRRLVWIGAGAVALAVGGSRVWLSVHWPSDVLGGWLWGVAWFGTATAVILLLRDRSARRRTSRSLPHRQREAARRS